MNKPILHPHAPGSRAARKAENAKRREAENAKRQAETIALRASQERGYTVVVRFALGAHDVRIVKADAIPEGYAESRIATRDRARLASALRQDTPPALRYVEAERLAESLRGSLDRNRDASRVVGSVRRRWA